MKMSIAYAAALPLLLVAAQGSAEPQEEQNAPILVDANQQQVQKWTRTVAHRLDQKLRAVRVYPRLEMPDGFAQVRFEIRNGEAVNVRLHRASGNNWVDRAARRSVQRLDNLPAMPFAEGRTVQANIITAKSDRAFDALTREMQKAEAARLASNGPDSMVIALNVGSGPAG